MSLIQVGNLSQALRTSLGLRGAVPLNLDAQVTPIVDVLDVSTPPYGRWYEPFCENIGVGAVAAQNGFALILGQGGIVQVLRVVLRHLAATTSAYSLNINSVKPGGVSASIAVVAGNTSFASAFQVPLLGSVQLESGNVAGLLGTTVDVADGFAATPRVVFDFGSDGYCLHPITHPTAVPCLSVWNNTLNEAFQVSVYGRFWRQAQTPDV